MSTPTHGLAIYLYGKLRWLDIKSHEWRYSFTNSWPRGIGELCAKARAHTSPIPRVANKINMVCNDLDCIHLFASFLR
jgi:hypothetical protein